MSSSTLFTVIAVGLLMTLATTNPARASAGGETSPGAAAGPGLPVIGMVAAAVLAALVIGRFRLLRMHGAPRRGDPLSPIGAVGAAAGLLLVGYLGVAIVAAAAGIEAGELSVPDQVRLGFAQDLPQIAIAIVWIAAARRAGARAARSSARAGGRRVASDVGAIVAGVVGLVLAWPILAVVSAVAGLAIERLGGPSPQLVAHESLRAVADRPADLWTIGLAVQAAVLAPVIEEVLYRGCLQGAFARVFGRGPAVLATSGIFMLMHVGAADPAALVALFVLSIGFGVVYERTGRLAAPIAMHALFNAANLALVLA